MTRNQLTGLSVAVVLVAIIGLVAWMTLSGGHDGMHDAGEAPMDDATFVAGMIPHHQSAVMMAEQVKAQTDNPAVAKLADGIIAAQEREIAQMREWRADWYGS
jgi:uncharacterized protein (DUF305 family)